MHSFNESEKVERLAKDKSITVVNFSQPNDENKENQPANHQSTKPGVAGMIYAINFNNSYFIYKGVKRKCCQSCTACICEDCGKCRFCLDKPKFGDKGKLKQCCYERRCKAKIEMNTKPTTTQIQSKVCILAVGEWEFLQNLLCTHSSIIPIHVHCLSSISMHTQDYILILQDGIPTGTTKIIDNKIPEDSGIARVWQSVALTTPTFL